jgi:hypothetical protein
VKPMIAPNPLVQKDFLGTKTTQDSSGTIVGRPKTAGYRPSVVWGPWQQWRHTPPFHIRRIPEMLTDARVRLGLNIIKGPIASKARIFVKCDNPLVKQFIVSTLTRFWKNSLSRALRAIDWGFSPGETVYKMDLDGTMQFDIIRELYPLDVLAIENWQIAEITGILIRNTPGGAARVLRAPRFFWHVVGREHQPIFGLSRLYGAWKPWLEKTSQGGWRDIRRLFYYKNAYDSGELYYPENDIVNTASGPVSAQQYAQDAMELGRTGATYCWPNTIDPNTSTRAWERKPPSSPSPPPGLEEWGNDLNAEILEGMEIPPEIAHAEGTGAYAGRLIPFQGFMMTEMTLLNQLLADFDTQVLSRLIEYNFGARTEYELMPFSLLDAVEKEEGDTQPDVGDPTNANANGTQQQAGISMSHNLSEFKDSGAIILTPMTGRWRRAA